MVVATVAVPTRFLSPSEYVALAIIRICEENELEFIDGGADEARLAADYVVGVGLPDPEANRFAGAHDAWRFLCEHAMAAMNVPERAWREGERRVEERLLTPLVQAPSDPRRVLTLHQTIRSVSTGVTDLVGIEAVAVFVTLAIRSLVGDACHRAVMWADDFKLLHSAHVEAVEFGSDYVVVARPTLMLHEYLRRADPDVAIKFALMPTADGKWRIHAADYPKRSFSPYIPIEGPKIEPTLEGAVARVNRARRDYYRLQNVPARIARWWGS